MDQAVKRGLGRPATHRQHRRAGLQKGQNGSRSRVVGAYHATREPSHAAAEDDAAEARRLHGRHAQLREQVGLPRVCAPRPLELVDGDLRDRLDVCAAQRQARVVEQDGWIAHLLDHCVVERVHLC